MSNIITISDSIVRVTIIDFFFQPQLEVSKS